MTTFWIAVVVIAVAAVAFAAVAGFRSASRKGVRKGDQDDIYPLW